MVKAQRGEREGRTVCGRARKVGAVDWKPDIDGERDKGRRGKGK